MKIGSPAVAKQTDEHDRGGDDDQRIIVCRACRALVTERRYAIVVDGQHQHTFFNPAGIAFEIGCWSNAQGCEAHGRPTSEFTWFAGFEWNFAVCRSCGALLGWFYAGEGGGFWGLIVNRLDEEELGAEDR